MGFNNGTLLSAKWIKYQFDVVICLEDGLIIEYDQENRSLIQKRHDHITLYFSDGNILGDLGGNLHVKFEVRGLSIVLDQINGITAVWNDCGLFSLRSNDNEVILNLDNPVMLKNEDNSIEWFIYGKPSQLGIVFEMNIENEKNICVFNDDMVDNIYIEINIDDPEIYYSNVKLSRGSDHTLLLKNHDLVVASEKLLKSWMKTFQLPWEIMKGRVILFNKEMVETLKYLKPIESLFAGLYISDTQAIKSAIRDITIALPLVRSFSSHYTSKRSMTKLLLMCINQIVLSCINYLTNNKTTTIWNQSKLLMIKKLNDCINLYDEVLKSYNDMRNKTKSDNREELIFSHETSLEKLYLFVNRMAKIKNVIETYRRYMVLSLSKISGINQIFEKFKNTYTSFTKISYDIFQVEDNTFDNDCAIFHNNIKECEDDFSKNIYSLYRAKPPIAWNMPMITGQMIWIASIHTKIEKPMNFFLTKSPNLWNNLRYVRIIKSYNSFCFALRIHELLLYSRWYKIANKLKDSKNIPLLIRDPKTRRYYCTFSRFLIETLNESYHMLYRQLTIPERLQFLIQRKDIIYQRHAYADSLVKRYNRMRNMIPPVFRNLINFEFMKLDKSLFPMMSVVTWSSYSAMDIMLDITKKFDCTEKYSKWLLNDYIRLPSEAKIINELENINAKHQEEIIKKIEKFSKSAEIIFHQLMNTILSRIINLSDEKYEWFDIEEGLKPVTESDGPPTFDSFKEESYPPAAHPKIKQVQDWCMIIFKRVNHPEWTAIIKVKLTLYPTQPTYTLELTPTWSEVKQTIDRITTDALKLSEKLTRWGFNNIIHRKYNYKFRNVWVNSAEKEVKINDFLKTTNKLADIRAQFEDIAVKENEINKEPEFVTIGPLEIELDEFKVILLNEVKEWQNLLTDAVLRTFRDKLKILCKYVEENYTLLAMPINELDDVRRVISCLEDVEKNFVTVDRDVAEIKNVFELLNTFKATILQEDEKRLTLLTETYEKLKIKTCEVPQRLVNIYVPMRMELKLGIKRLKSDIFIYDTQFNEKGPMVSGLTPSEASERVIIFQDKFDELVVLMDRYQEGERLFGVKITEYPSLTEKKRIFNLLQKLYGLYVLVNHSMDTWLNTTWSRLRIDDISEKLAEYSNRCRKLPKGLTEWPAYLELKKKIDNWSLIIPLVEMMIKNSLKERHWTMIEKVTNTPLPIDNSDFMLKNIMNAPLIVNKDEIEDICQTAIKEMDIEAKLRQVISDWSTINVELTTFKSRGFLLVKGQELAEVVALLEDSQMVMSSLATNRYNVAFKTEISDWVRKFAITGQVLENWIIVQNLWTYLEAVFVGGDIAKQLPLETKRFSNIDKLWVQIMTRAKFTENVIEICTGDDSMEILLPYLKEQLELCQKSLAGYLDQKRNIFPRFYFVSDPVLLEILGQASNSHAIEPHLLSLFDNIAKLTFNPLEYDKALEMISKEGEGIPFEHPVMCIGGVENWLNTLLIESKNTVNQVMSNVAAYMTNPDFSLLTMVNTFPSQMGLVGIQMLWTYYTENAISNALLKKTIMKQTNDYFIVLLNTLIDCTTLNLTKMERVKYETLITIHVHQRDIFETLYRMKVSSLTDFEWLKQERFYFNLEVDQCEVRITDVTFIYQNEFLGCSDRLVITPLTDRCYITLAQGIGMNMGGAPAGPAGTGKTETTKDMGKSLGKYVVVFNCSDQMDFRGLGRIFKGLVQSGTWGCFDEFNRIELPVLSVAAQQIYLVFSARRDKKSTFLFSDGDIIPMNPEFAIFLTMNPGYAGRQELPENLKVLFRSVAMMVPDRLIIIRVKMAAAGFKNNIVLSKKFFILYQLCEEQLSKQVHYDFGLRNILAVLRTLGTQRRGNLNDSEETILMRVLRDMNVSKLVDQDAAIFMSLIEDLFVGLKLTTSTYKDLQASINKSCNEFLFVNDSTWNLKIIQVYETSLVRHGLMILGPTGAGKTAAIHTLLAALTKNGLPHFEYRMNPKAITAPQMFGRLDVATNDWTDGIFSTLWRKTLKLEPGEFCWIVLDGPVDAVWIENLNSVLDDNKTLTLANGDRIVMASNAKLAFEPDNVDNASPATISRMGMTYFSSTVLSWKIIFQGWGKKRSKHEFDCLQHLFDNSYDGLLKVLNSKLTAKMTLLEAHYIHQTCDLLDGLLSMFNITTDLSENTISRLYTFSIMWSLAAVLESLNRQLLEDYILKDMKGIMSVPKLKEGETIYEYTVSKNGEWMHWSSLVDEYMYPRDYTPSYGDILVPNLDNVRAMFLISLIANQEKNVLLIGEQGTAKTVMIKSFMQEFDQEKRLSKMLNFSSATTPNMFQNTIEGYMEKRFGTTYGPPGNRKMSVFIDDINMPIINDWGDQVTNEITRQLLEGGGFYSLVKPGEFINIVGVNMLAAMIHPGGGRNDIPPRLKRQFCIFNCTLPSDTSMDKIFGTLGSGYFCKERFEEQIVQFVPKLVPLTRLVWQKTKIKLLPTPANFHYVFNLRDLSRIWEGMLQIGISECPNVQVLLKLWCHELLRVVYDKLTNAADKEWFFSNLLTTTRDYLNNEDFKLFPSDINKTVFVDFLRDMPEPTGDEPDDFVFEDPKVYEEIEDFVTLEARVLMYMTQMNEVIRGSNMDLVFFRDCMVHLVIISRILRIPRGNALLVGVGGSGRRSVTSLASFIAGYFQHKIFMTRTYNVNNFLDDIRLLYRKAGFEDKKTTFVFTDNDIKEEAFLEYLNNILSSGEVANLFAKDELEEMLSTLTPTFRKKNPKGIPTLDNLYEFFIKQATQNLHVVLCFSPIGESFRLRALKFPGIISGCIIDWYTSWPLEALHAVSHHFLKDFNIVGTNMEKNSLIQMLGEIHNNVTKDCINYQQRFRRQIYVTPKSFLSFIDGYKNLYKENVEQIENMKVQRVLGLEKLADASLQVEVLKLELVEKEKEIAVANAACNEVTTKVNKVVEIAEKSKAEVVIVKDKAEQLLKVISKEKKIAEGKLAKAKPALDAAEAALNTIEQKDIATVRSLKKPPILITLIMDCVLILFKRPLVPVTIDRSINFLSNSYEYESKKFMGEGRFLEKLKNFPKDQINGELIDLMQTYFKYPDYTLENANKACGDVAGLISWTKAMAEFYKVNTEVLPLKMNLAKQEAKHNKAKEELREAEAIAAEKNRELMEAKRKLKIALDSQGEVQAEADKCKNKMMSATALIDGLVGERKRWTQQLAGFNVEIKKLLGDIVILTGFLSYSGPFNQEYRTHIIQSWYNQLHEKNIPNTVDLSIIDKLVDPPTISEWNLQGLPNDELSTQNGIIVTQSPKYPVLIDPQSQGLAWIKNKELVNQMKVTSFDNKYFRNHLEDCVSLGKPLLIQDILQDVDPVLENVLEKNYFKVGRNLKVSLGDKEVDIHESFRMYITTKLSNPSYSPELYARCSIIDFTVTLRGLEDQLLSRVIETEKRELELERVELIAEVTSQKRKMQKLEYDLLVKLTTVKGSLVDDESVLYTLNKTKDTAADVNEKIKIATQTQASINLVREEYRPIATRGSVLYFLIVEMGMINSMYQNSLQQFIERFDLSLMKSEASLILSRRISNIIKTMTYDIFKYKCRGLYEKDKTLFTVIMTLKIDMEQQNITKDQFEYFIKGGASIDLNSIKPKPFAWITDICWMNLGLLQTISPFQEILNIVSQNEKQWKTWYEKSTPEKEVIPNGLDKLSQFERLLIVRAWCPDRTLNQAFAYIEESLGPKFVESIMFDIEEMYLESRNTTPLICFLSMGSDPSNLIENTAKKLEIPFRSISMGQGQEIHARVLMENCNINGGWVLLQNCHLCLDYMQETYVYLITRAATTQHENFRVWITTEPHPKFPISLLQIAVHYTYEPPEGLRAGLKRTYNNMGQDIFDYSSVPQYRSILYAISFLHSVVQERRKFGPIGWNIPYEFNTSDWYSSTLYLQKMVDEMTINSPVNWVSLRYMLAEVHYGGRVTDDYDRRLLNNFTVMWFVDKIFDDQFNFYKNYNILHFKKLSHYLTAIENMSLKDPPQACGLHPNADITYQTNIIQNMFDKITFIQPKGSGGDGEFTREDKVLSMTNDILKKLPATFNMFKVKERLSIMGATQPMNIFLGQEIDRIQVVIDLVRNTLEDLLLAIEGIIIMNEVLSTTLDFLYDGRIPTHWIRPSWTSSSISFWFNELLERQLQISTWIFKEKPSKFWLTGFFNPQGFLTAMKQEISRAHTGWTLDNMVLDNRVTIYSKYEIGKQPTEGVYVYGLFLDGASWNKKSSVLQESLHKILITEMPVIHIYAINLTKPRTLTGYQCPVYKKPRRTGLFYICQLNLNTPPDLHGEHWILRGVALLCDVK
ncbi:dynein axonemal heavy chain 8-like [Daktulosphaira vitifoliae]|uniref:dynein axonemal heavy chain 8-like n=1 Tax=Daktulosphaira vitifoliae TaxID=58002 RepID=UPI0021AA7C58|nr:dynein axonemal heavy chain 8-like [Daktulosphaira vitifoliae]